MQIHRLCCMYLQSKNVLDFGFTIWVTQRTDFKMTDTFMLISLICFSCLPSGDNKNCRRKKIVNVYFNRKSQYSTSII